MASSTPDYTSPSQLRTHLSRVFRPLSALTPLHGGFANYTYRATLSSLSSPSSTSPISPGIPTTPTTVIIKHGEPFVALAQNIALDTSRVYIEFASLSCPPPAVTTALGWTVGTPIAHHYDSESHSVVVADAGSGSRDLKAILCSAAGLDADAEALGEALGVWLRRLHSWGRTEAAEELREALGGNTQAAGIWTWATYGRLLETVALLPAAELGGAAALFAEIVAATPAVQLPDTVLHGDFWCGNVLLDKSTVTIIDWEMARVGEVWGDLAQMCAELYLPFRFFGVETGIAIMRAFLGAYGRVSEDIASRVVVHFGVHLAVWPARSGWEPQTEAVRCAVVGKEFIEKGWRRDWKWVKDSVLGELVDDSWIV